MTRYSSIARDEDEAESFQEVEHIHTPEGMGKRTKIAGAMTILLAVAGLSAAVIVPSVRNTVSSLDANFEESLLTTNELESRTGRKLNDGLFQNLVRVHSPTKLELKSGAPAIFYAEEKPHSDKFIQVNTVASSGVDHTFTEIGHHQVKAVVQNAHGKYETHEFRVISKVIRSELRDLTESDRLIYFDALQTFQGLSQQDGMAAYGKGFRSLQMILRDHLYGAADKACDHWHDDAGMVNHHIAITWEFEQSLRTIDPRTASHYWDYTRESAKGTEWYDSNIFDDDWFGSNSPNNALHIVDKGRFAYSPVFSAVGFSDISNPYGLLRSPWNTNPTAYVIRSNKTFFNLGDSSSEFPSCSKFATTLHTSLAETIFSLNGGLHGPVHIMIGGHWGNAKKWTYLGENMALTDKFLLLSKWLWRAGFVRTPESCSSDTAHEDCMPTCPEGIIGKDITDEKAYQLLDKTGIFMLNPSGSTLETLLDESGLGWSDLLTELCHVGSPGDMFTSAAPQDPTFWPLHGNAERLVSLYRVMDKQGEIEFDQTWGYEHSKYLPSDTGMVCDWSDVTGTLDMPTCAKGICSGHKEDDLLPFTDLGKGQGTTLYTNAEFYELVDPFNGDLPYAYDSLNYWEGCEGGSIVAQYNYDKFGSFKSPETSYWDQFYNGIWGVM